MLPTEQSSSVLIGNRVESIIPYHTGDEFSIIAEDNGEIVDIKENIVIVKYKNGSYKSIDTSVQVKKNASSGFFIESQLKCDYKIGDKIKKGAILAYNPKIFTKNEDENNISLNIGVLCKLAILSTWDIFEDSAPITKKLSEKMTSVMVWDKSVALPAHTIVDYIVKVGDSVKTGDTLIRFDSAGDDPEATTFLSAIRAELGEEIIESLNTSIKSKYTGEIVDIKIYSTIDLEEMDPSLQKIVSEHYNKIKRKNRVIDKYKNPNDSNYYKSGILVNEVAEKINPNVQGKIKGIRVDNGVLIVFYIKYYNQMAKGDKLTAYSALKATVAHVIDEGLEPYSEYRPEEEISSFVAPIAVEARKTPSIFLSLFGNKLMIELKRQLKEKYLAP